MDVVYIDGKGEVSFTPQYIVLCHSEYTMKVICDLLEGLYDRYIPNSQNFRSEELTLLHSFIF